MLTSEACNDIAALFWGGGGVISWRKMEERGYIAQQSWVLNVLLDSNDITITGLMVFIYSNPRMLNQKSLDQIEQLKKESYFTEAI